jgi:hypothetical protein
VSADLDGWASQSRFDLREVQQGVVFTPRDQTQARGHDIGQRSGIAREPIETDQDLGKRQRKSRGVMGDDPYRAFQFSPIVPIACAPKGSHPLMGMRLKNRGARAHDLASLAPHVAWGRHLIKATMRRRKRFELGKSSLAGYLPGAVDIHDHLLLTATIPQASRGSERLSPLQILLKERPKGLQRCLIEGSKKTRERRAVRQAIAPKERHKGAPKRQESLIERFEGGFTA